MVEDPRVALVGSGPGDPDLLTLKAARLLRAADVVLYDDLSSGPILKLARAGAELVAVGKRAGRPSPRQEEVNAQLLAHARSGKRVVRLKSGDPGVFGRLEEEILALRAAGVAFEIVPGVPSANAAAAAAGIAMTRRLSARRAQCVTGHDVAGKLPGDLEIAALADPRAVTAVFMPQRTFPALAAKLIEAGLSPETPALMAENVSRPDQRLTRDSVAGLAARLEAGVSPLPAIILYGPLMEAVTTATGE